MAGYSRVPKLVNAITKTVVKATMGSGAKPAVKKPFPKSVKPTLKKSSPDVRAKTDAIQKSSVKVKPAAKPKGNPFNQRKANEEMYSSASRGGVGKGPLGKARSARVARSVSPAGKKMAKAERKENSRYWKDMKNSVDG